MYDSEPSSAPLRVMLPAWPSSAASPKSTSSARPLAAIMTLDGLTSRCMIPRPCACASASVTCTSTDGRDHAPVGIHSPHRRGGGGGIDRRHQRAQRVDEDATGEHRGLGVGERSQQLRQRDSLDVLHRQVGQPATLADAEHRDDVGVIKPRHRLGLAAEAPALRVEEREVRPHDLERDVPPEALLTSPKHHSHPADSEPLAQRELTEPVGNRPARAFVLLVGVEKSQRLERLEALGQRASRSG